MNSRKDLAKMGQIMPVGERTVSHDNTILDQRPVLITNATLVNEGRQWSADVLIRHGRIERIDAQISAPENAEIIDAQGQHLLPGMIDDQVHFREPGLDQKGNLKTESAAAVAGGITSFMEMPNTQPPTTTHEALAEKYQRASGRCTGNYAFYLGATNDNIDVIRTLDPNQAAGIKVFMGASTGNMLVDRAETLEQIFRDAPCLVATHCEDTPSIQQNLRAAKEKYGVLIPPSAHPEIRDVEACYRSSSMAVALAKEHGTRLHVLHLTTAKELDLFDAGPIANKQITAEACVHHLYFSQEDYATLGNQIKCNPAIKSRDDRAALIRALIDEKLDIIATDHAPHLWVEKSSSDYLQAAAGLPLVQHAMPLALELVHQQHLSLEAVVAKTSHNVAIRYQVKERGYLREGYWADLTLVDMNSPWTVNSEDLMYRCGWSPLKGRTFNSRINRTWVNGYQVWDGQQHSGQFPGVALEFQR